MTEALAISTENVLHPRQVVDLTETKARLEGIMGAAPYIRNQLQDGGAMVQKQIGGIDKMLEQAPKPLPADQIDEAVKLEATLREDWLDGMPTQAEMRRNAPGCVDKNMAWDRAKKRSVLAWKQLKRRLHASGISEHRLADEGDISNIEMFRPRGGSGEMSMDNAQIPERSVTKFPPPGAGPAAVMSDAQSAMLKSIKPELHDKMALLDNVTRAAILDVIDQRIESAGAGKAQAAPSRSARAPKRAKAAKRAKRAKGPRSEKQLASDARLRELAKSRNAARGAATAAQEG